MIEPQSQMQGITSRWLLRVPRWGGGFARTLPSEPSVDFSVGWTGGVQATGAAVQVIAEGKKIIHAVSKRDLRYR
jgi:hypothetical protein